MLIKAAEDRQPVISQLEALRGRRDVSVTQRRAIEAELRAVQAGWQGERDAAYEIELWFGRSKNWATIHDLRIEVDGFAGQIDHLLINRLGQIWVCESKHFGEGVAVNEHGEWSRYWRGKPYGIASPIEQNARHILLLRRVFDDGLAPLPRRLGLVPMRPEFRSIVLVSNNARIGRPRKPVVGLDRVIKAEQLRTRVFDAYDHEPSYKLGRLIGRDGLESLARGLVALHRPVEIDWLRRFGVDGSASVGAASTVVSHEAGAAPTSQWTCAECGRAVSEAVVDFCRQHATRFGGAIYCYSHQRTRRRA